MKPIPHMKLIVNCGPCEAAVARSIHSIRGQSFEDWRAHVTVDPCGDDSYALAVKAAEDDPRIEVTLNKRRLYSLHNLVRAIRRSRAAADDVIVTLDGDDWFSTKYALETIARAYRKHDCWMTYGSWRSNVTGPGGRRDGAWPAYDDATENFRHTRWLGTAVRTWKKWLWDRLDHADLRNDAGCYFRIAEDQAVMLPLLEMCGTARAKHIARPLMIYNKKIRYEIPREVLEEREQVALLLERRPPYKRLQRC